MSNSELSLEKTYENEIDNFAKDTLKQVGEESKIFGATINQITNAMGSRK